MSFSQEEMESIQKIENALDNIDAEAIAEDAAEEIADVITEDSIEKMLESMDIGEGFEMPRLGKSNCRWCWGKGFARINGAVSVCRCLTPKSKEQKDVETGRLQAVKLGKHIKGRSRWFGKPGTWKEIPELIGTNSAPSTVWKFFSSRETKKR